MCGNGKKNVKIKKFGTVFDRMTKCQTNWQNDINVKN